MGKSITTISRRKDLSARCFHLKEQLRNHQVARMEALDGSYWSLFCSATEATTWSRLGCNFRSAVSSYPACSGPRAVAVGTTTQLGFLNGHHIHNSMELSRGRYKMVLGLQGSYFDRPLSVHLVTAGRTSSFSSYLAPSRETCTLHRRRRHSMLSGLNEEVAGCSGTR
jgi:hypothetical protein